MDVEDGMFWIIVALVIVFCALGYFAVEETSKLRKECEAKQGVFYSPEGESSICIRKEYIIK